MKNLAILFSCVFLGACASTQSLSLSANHQQAMQGKSLVLVQRESPGFVAMTSGKGMFAVAGVGAAVAAGNSMVRENGIADPSIEISRALSRGLASQYGMTVAGETGRAESGDIDQIIRLAGDQDYALDIVTNGWSYMYDGFSFGDYYVGYSSKLRLVDVHSAEVVSSGMCMYDAKKAGKPAVTHETLLADNAEYIKQELADAASRCVEEFGANLFDVQAVASAGGND